MNELNAAVLTLVIKKIKNGNIAHCLNLGFTLDEINKIQTLSANDIACLSESCLHIMNISVNHTSLLSQIGQIKAQQMRDRQIERAIILGGSFELLTHYFGLSSQEISMKKQLLGVESSLGRYRQLTEAESYTV